MPFVRVNKNNAWTLYKQGLITGINSGMDELENKVVNLAINKGLNAIRLHLTDDNDGLGDTLVVRDYLEIGRSYAADTAAGWNSSTLTETSANNSGSITLADVGSRITELLDQCAQLGVGVILALPFWGERGGRLWVDQAGEGSAYGTTLGLKGSPVATTAAGVQTGLVNFWRATAAKWGSHPAMIGYDIVNEPDPDPRTAWLPVATNVINAIRVIDAETPVVLEGVDIGASSGLTVFEGHPLLTNFESLKIVFSFHAYGPAVVTHGGLTEWAYEHMGVTYPITGSITIYGSSDLSFSSITTPAQLMAAYYSEADSFKRVHKVPMFVGEFSFINQTGQRPFVTGEDTEGQPLEFYQPEETAYCRQVTSITVSPTTVTLVMGNIEKGQPYSGGRQGLGFAIDTDPRSPSDVRLLADIGNATTGLSNTVKVSLLKVGVDAASRLAEPGTAPYDAFLAQARTANGDIDYATFDAVIDALNIVDREVTIRRSQNTYVIQRQAGDNWDGVASIARQSPVMDGAALVRYPAVGVVSLSPSSANLALQARSREIYTRHSLQLWTDRRFSWAWHASTFDVRRTWWSPTGSIYTLLNQAAQGRVLPSAS